MRASPIGLYYRKDLNKLLEVAMADAAITHNSHEPKMGSVAVALGVALAANSQSNLYLPNEMLEEVHEVLAPSIVKDKLALAIAHIKNNSDPKQALAAIGAGGYVPETVGAAFYCFAKGEDFRDVVTMAIRAGGDTDTTAAVAGALAGTFYGLDEIPSEYKDNVENFQLLQDLTDELINNEI
jgi:ADP-ribosylglycohydrolase